jgi:hypothetical protein
MKTLHRKKTQTPTETIQKWIRDFVTQPNPVFGNLPPCPFAQKAMVDNKVEFVELNSTADWRTIYQLIWNTDFDDKEVLCVIADPEQFTATETVGIADELNSRFMDKDIVILEDHPDIEEKVKAVKLNNGHYTLFLAQRLSKLNRYSEMLEKGPYYRNWSRSYLESVKGFRDPKTDRS